METSIGNPRGSHEGTSFASERHRYFHPNISNDKSELKGKKSEKVRALLTTEIEIRQVVCPGEVAANNPHQEEVNEQTCSVRLKGHSPV